jgi:hypothetical protein
MYIESLRPDSKGRITLGKLAKGVSSYHVYVDEKSGNITLQPFAEVPMPERWLFQNNQALTSVLEGIKQSTAGQVIDLGDFTSDEGTDEL